MNERAFLLRSFSVLAGTLERIRYLRSPFKYSSGVVLENMTVRRKVLFDLYDFQAMLLPVCGDVLVDCLEPKTPLAITIFDQSG